VPQVEQLQVYYWGALRADPIDLAVDGINVATGPNGSGKTTGLDALKLMLGVADLSRRPADYIFDGGGAANARGERALIKVIFANPDRGGHAGRVFSDAGRGCEQSAHVTAICEIDREGHRRYTLLAGAHQWGAHGRDLEADIHALRTQIPASQWLKPRAWEELLARAGVSRALRGVIAIRQGETDKTIEGSPEALLKRVLELTGKQRTLEEFRDARAKLAAARSAYDETNRRFASERRHLDALTIQAGHHREYVRIGEELATIEQVKLPAAERVEMLRTRENLQRERDGQAAALQAARAEHETLEAEIPQRNARQDELTAEKASLAERDRAARQANEDAAAAHAAAASELTRAETALAAARELVGDTPLDDTLAAAALREAVAAAAGVQSAEAEADAVRAEISELRAGRPVRPAGLDRFRQALTAAGIEHRLIAEHLEVSDAVPGEAVLGDGVWGLVVAVGQLERAVELAVAHEHRLPLIAAGPGAPAGVLAGGRGLDEARAYLAEIDVALGAPGVSADGVIRGRAWAAWRAPRPPVLGAAAREQRLADAQRRLAELTAELPGLRAAADEAARRSEVLARAVEIAPRVGALCDEQARLHGELKRARAAAARVVEQLGAIERELGEIAIKLDIRTRRRAELARGINERAPLMATYDERLSTLAEQIAVAPKPPAELDLNTLPDAAALRRDHDALAAQREDEQRFPPEIRTEMILATHDAQQRAVEEVAELLEGRSEDLAAVVAEVERAKQRYDEHIRQVVHLLARRFREVCEQAGMDGDIQLRPGESDGEFGIDVAVAHVRGEPRRSYRNPAHSTGQKAKISLLMLLSAMGLEGSADLLIMDEHAAHLDSRNIDAVAEVMKALKHRVQFILATPTNAEAGRLAWCDHQIAFYPRADGEPFAPPVRLYTREPADDQRYADMGQLSLAQ
jgi:chromosome segregation ATPase